MGRRNLVLGGRIKSSNRGRRSKRLRDVSDGDRVEGMTGLTKFMMVDVDTMTGVDNANGTEVPDTTDLVTCDITVSTEVADMAED